MINLPGLLVEYIISGAIALIWIVLLFYPHVNFGTVLKDHGALATILAVPIAYVIGMTLDMFVYPFIKHFKKKIRIAELREAQREGGYLFNRQVAIPDKSFTDQLVIDLHFRGMIKEINWRSSRDRIARGMILNILGFGITLIIYLKTSYQNALLIIAGLVLCTLAAMFVYIWSKFEKISYRFQLLTYIYLKDQWNSD